MWIALLLNSRDSPQHLETIRPLTSARLKATSPVTTIAVGPQPPELFEVPAGWSVETEPPAPTPQGEPE